MFRRTASDDQTEYEPVLEPMETGRHALTSDVSVVGKGARLEGTVTISGSLQVEGNIKGEIKADGDVDLSSQGRVEGDIEGENVRVAGTLNGHIRAKNKAHLAHGARVEGDVTSKTLVVEEGAFFQGTSHMGERVVRESDAYQPIRAPEPERSPAGY